LIQYLGYFLHWVSKLKGLNLGRSCPFYTARRTTGQSIPTKQARKAESAQIATRRQTACARHHASCSRLWPPSRTAQL